MFVFVCFLIGELFFATVFLSSFSLNYLMQVFWPVLNTQQTKKKTSLLTQTVDCSILSVSQVIHIGLAYTKFTLSHTHTLTLKNTTTTTTTSPAVLCVCVRETVLIC